MEKGDKARLEDIRRRFGEVGLEAVSSQEALELLLSYAAPRADNRALSRELLRQYGSLKALLSASPNQLRHTGGLGEYTAVFLSLVSQIGRQIFLERMEGRPDAFASVADIGRYFMELVKGQPREALYQLCLNGDTFLSCGSLTDGGALSEEMEARGELVRRIVEDALASAANAVALCRRLSGGLLAPSVADRIVMEKARAALDTVRVDFRDYILVTDNDFVSMSETGVLTRPWGMGDAAAFSRRMGEEYGTL